MRSSIKSGKRRTNSSSPTYRNKPPSKEAENPVDRKISGNIRVENVYFAYSEKPVLKNVSLTAEGGEVVGIVGPNGSGKTTLTKLLLRFYDVNEGRILIDDVDIRKIKLERLGKSIGIVAQDPFLFDNFVLFNIHMVLKKWI
ncbi:MAG: ABC transporter ATP-binding protein [Thermoproteota archaeon]|uniref:ABC transporter ATP-binding protein n=1 Tax=Thermoprotei TaxID=183924 RepID=UPI00316A26EA